MERASDIYIERERGREGEREIEIQRETFTVALSVDKALTALSNMPVPARNSPREAHLAG